MWALPKLIFLLSDQLVVGDQLRWHFLVVQAKSLHYSCAASACRGGARRRSAAPAAEGICRLPLSLLHSAICSSLTLEGRVWPRRHPGAACQGRAPPRASGTLLWGGRACFHGAAPLHSPPPPLPPHDRRLTGVCVCVCVCVLCGSRTMPAAASPVRRPPHAGGKCKSACPQRREVFIDCPRHCCCTLTVCSSPTQEYGCSHVGIPTGCQGRAPPRGLGHLVVRLVHRGRVGRPAQTSCGTSTRGSLRKLAAFFSGG